MLTVHHLSISQSDRVVWLCEELGLTYELVRYQRDPVTRLAPPEYVALHPAGTAPVITDDDITLAESAAIIDYICAKHGDRRLTLDRDHPNYADFLYWYHSASGSFMPAIMWFSAEGPVAEIMHNRMSRHLVALDERLSKATWLAGDEFTIADIIMAFPLTTTRLFVPLDLSPYPAILAYLQRVGQRPAFARAMQKADPELQIPLD